MLNAIKNKKKELLISLLMVLILLTVASTLMYFLENKAQPDVFTSIFATLWWGVATLTTVGYGDIYPITAAGKLLGGIISILGVGMFALPAGIIASGFMEEIENKKKHKSLIKLELKLKYAFSMEYVAPVIRIKKNLNLSHLPRKWLSLNDIKYKMGISESSVLEVVKFSKLFRLRNVKFEEHDKSGLEYIESNRVYGNCLSRKSNITIINLYSTVQPFYGHFSMAIADKLKANYISNEFFSKVSLIEENQLDLIRNENYFNNDDSHLAISQIKQDVKALLSKNNTCVFLVNAAKNENLLQFNTGAEVGNNSFDNGIFFTQNEKLQNCFNKADQIAKTYNLKVLKHGSVGKPNTNHMAWYIHKEIGCNILMLYVNISILKKNPVEYYQHVDDFTTILGELT